MAKKVKSKQKQKQKQRQSQSVKVVVNLAKPKTKRRRRAAPREPAQQMPQQIALPPVVYQMPPPLTFYGQPEPAREQSLVNVTAGRTIGEMPASRIPVMEEQRQPDITETQTPVNVMESVKGTEQQSNIKLKGPKELAEAAKAKRQSIKEQKNAQAREEAAAAVGGQRLDVSKPRTRPETSTEPLWTNINNNNNNNNNDGV
jgi:hypothetical protein